MRRRSSVSWPGSRVRTSPRKRKRSLGRVARPPRMRRLGRLWLPSIDTLPIRGASPAVAGSSGSTPAPSFCRVAAARRTARRATALTPPMMCARFRPVHGRRPTPRSGVGAPILGVDHVLAAARCARPGAVGRRRRTRGAVELLRGAVARRLQVAHRLAQSLDRAVARTLYLRHGIAQRLPRAFRELGFVFPQKLLRLVGEGVGAVALLHLLATAPVLLLVRPGVRDHPLDLLPGQAGALGDGDPLL